MTVAYVYKWTHLPTLQWYIGSRTKKDCHPSDGYICSSKLIKPRIKANPTEWQRTVIATGSADAMIALETELLTAANAKHDTRSFNGHNGDGCFTVHGRPKSEEHKAKLRKWNLGRKLSKETCELMSLIRTGKKHKQVTCPQCGKVGGDNNMYRYHFNNCATLVSESPNVNHKEKI